MSVRLLLGSAALAGVALGAMLFVLVGRTSTSTAPAVALPQLHGQATWHAGARPAPAIRLRDQTGAAVSLRALRGQVVVLTFLDPLCRSQCPIEGRALSRIVRRLPAAARPTLLVVSVNPRATVHDAALAAQHWGFTGLPRWHWLLGPRARLGAVWRRYGVTVEPTTHDVVHSLVLYLVDRRGDERTAYLFPFLPSFVEGDLQRLAQERA